MKKYIVIRAGIFLLPGCVVKRYLTQLFWQLSYAV
jgi:hypothetical protein